MAGGAALWEEVVAGVREDNLNAALGAYDRLNRLALDRLDEEGRNTVGLQAFLALLNALNVLELVRRNRLCTDDSEDTEHSKCFEDVELRSWDEDAELRWEELHPTPAKGSVLSQRPPTPTPPVTTVFGSVQHWPPPYGLHCMRHTHRPATLQDPPHTPARGTARRHGGKKGHCI